MGIIQDIFARLQGRIPVRGTITTPTGDEDTPVAVSNEIMGGPFIANDLGDLKEIPIERIIKGCKCTVNQHTDGEGVLVPTRTYLNIVVPSEKLSESGEDVSGYWILDRPQQDEEGAIESQYSADYQGMKPPFLPTSLSKAAYNAGYANNEDFEAGDTSKIIWKSDYDDITHKWVRQRTGTLADWGIPVSLDGGYQEGNYSDVRFQWRLKTLGAPAKPNSSVDGFPNNDPVGWEDTPDIPEGEDYYAYIVDNDLWRISATKGVYGDLLTEWTTPIMVSTDPNLVRYGIDPYSTDYLNDTYWRPYYSPDDKYKASRETTGSSWKVEKISGESGEYIDYVFKEFENSYEPVDADKPTTTLGYGINGWRDGVFTAQEGYTLYVSTARKFSDGTISSFWTLPVRYDGQNTIRAVVVSLDNTGHTFKKTQVDGAEVITPESITLKAKLFEAIREVPVEEIEKVEWYTGSGESGSLIPKLPIGTEPNRNPQYGGVNDTELTVFPENVLGSQEFTARVYFRDEDYFDSIDVIDTTDGIGYQAVVEGSSGYIYKGTESKDFTAYIYENGVDISASNNVSFVWTLNGDSLGTDRVISVDDTQVDGITVLELSVNVLGSIYTRTEALTDISDGKSVERQYTAKEDINLNNTPDTSGNPDEWRYDSADAYWAIERFEGDDWNTPYRIRGEQGTPNGAFQKTVYRTRVAGTTPDWLTQKPQENTIPADNLIPDGWIDVPEASAPTGSEIYGTKATFLKNPITQEVTELVQNWNIDSAKWSLPFKVTTFPEAGDNGAPGTDGEDGWSPKIAVVSDGSRRVQKLVEWIGGTGAKPPNEGYYIGSTGLVASISNATDIRGATGATGPKGDDGVFNSSDFWDGETYKITGSNGSPNYEAWDVRFRKAKNGMVYYSIRTYRNGSGGRNVNLSLGSTWTSKMIPLGYYQAASAGGNGVHAVLPGRAFEINKDSPSIYGDTGGVTIRRVSGSWKVRVLFQDNCTFNHSGCYAANGAL